MRPCPSARISTTCGPISFYGVTKLVGEHYVRVYSRLHGLRATCLRFFTAYGPRQRPDMAIHAFTAAIDQGREIPMFGDGSTERDYTFVTDIVQGLLGAIDTPEPFAIYNLGESRTVTLRRLIELIGENVGKTPRIKQLPEQPGDVQRTCARSTGPRPAGLCPEGRHRGRAEEQFVAWYRERGITRTASSSAGGVQGKKKRESRCLFFDRFEVRFPFLRIPSKSGPALATR
jgi:UDP-glucuronate 4-epimerase